MSWRLGFAMQQLENSLCQSSSKWLPFANFRRAMQEKETELLRLEFTAPRYSGVLTSLPLWLLDYGTLLPFSKIPK